MDAVEALNMAFKADPDAVYSLLCNRVPCNRFLADDPFVQVDGSSGNYQVGALGLVNAVLAASGLPLVAAKFSDERDTEGRAKLLGFCEYSCSVPSQQIADARLIAAAPDLLAACQQLMRDIAEGVTQVFDEPPDNGQPFESSCERIEAAIKKATSAS